jgi:hypothetical protein
LLTKGKRKGEKTATKDGALAKSRKEEKDSQEEEETNGEDSEGAGDGFGTDEREK